MRLREILGGVALLVMGACVAPEQAFVSDVEHFDPDHTAIVELRQHQPNGYGELKIFLRTDSRFAEDSLTVRVVTFSPDSLRTEEYHRLIIPQTRRINALKQVVEIPYRRGVTLRKVGTYYFSLTPTRSVEGVEAVGICFRTE